jgi:hypothetical protein
MIPVSIYVHWRSRVRATQHIQRWRPHGCTDRDPKLVQTLIGAIGTVYPSRRSRVRIHARAARANVRTTLHIQRWRTNGLTDRELNWYKHSLGQSAQFTRVGDRECAFMRALRAQTCAHHYISSVGAHTAGLNETPIGSNTHWGNWHNL